MTSPVKAVAKTAAKTTPGPGPKAAPQVAAQAAPQAAPRYRLSIRIDLASGARIGPGKIALLEAIAQSGSISGAGRALKMSYRRAWDLVEQLNHSLGEPVVETETGGAGGGGSRLTQAGERLVRQYRAVEQAAMQSAARYLAALAPGKEPEKGPEKGSENGPEKARETGAI